MSAIDTVRRFRNKREDTTKLSRAELADLIVTEAEDANVSCTPGLAHQFIAMLGKAAGVVRKARGYDPDSRHVYCYHIQQGELDLMHDLLAVILKPGVHAPAPGTAHAELNRALLKGGEVALVHTWDPDTEARDCAVAVHVEAFA